MMEKQNLDLMCFVIKKRMKVMTRKYNGTEL